MTLFLPNQLKSLLFASVLTALLFAACGSAAPASETAVETDQDTSQPIEQAVEQAQPAQNEDDAADQTAELNLAPNIDVQTAAAVMDRDDVFMLDVREPSEYEAGHIPDITLIPVGQVADRLSEIPKDKHVVISCHSGVRSARIFNYLTQQGYTNIHNMEGGIVAWQQAGFEVEQ